MSKAIQTTYTNLKEHKGGKRLWLEGLRLSDAGFDKGCTYTVSFDVDNNCIDLVLADGDSGTHVVAGRKRRGNDTATPIIDLCNKNVVKTFNKGLRVRAEFFDGNIRITLHHEEKSRIAREERTMQHVAEGRITEGGMCTGIGVATHAVHAGLSSNGLKATVEWVIDIEGRYLQVACDNNDAITASTRLFEGSLEEIEPELLGFVDVAQISLPCTGHSKSGKSKNKIKNAEDHDTAATSLFGFINIINAVNPTIIVSENVVEAKDSTTYTLIRKELERRGYVIHERIMGRKEAGSLEDRNRYWFVAVSMGLDNFDLNNLPQFKQTHNNLGDIMENVSDDDKMWSQNSYLKDKAIRDAKEGKGFAKRQLVTAETESVGTIGRHYNKRRSTEPFFVRDGGWERLFTTKEHAAVKGIPYSLVEGQLATVAHEGLGQSVLYNHALGLGQYIAQMIPLAATEESIVAKAVDTSSEIVEHVSEPAFILNDTPQISLFQ